MIGENIRNRRETSSDGPKLLRLVIDVRGRIHEGETPGGNEGGFCFSPLCLFEAGNDALKQQFLEYTDFVAFNDTNPHAARVSTIYAYARRSLK